MLNLKQQVGYKAAEFVQSGMTVGLGTGSTAYYLVEALGKRVKEENLDIIGVATSTETKEQALSLNIPHKNLDEVDYIDLTIDGADEVSDDFQGIKGGGGALLFEKLVASNSAKNIWIIDNNKRVTTLGEFPLPVEIVKYGSNHLFKKFKDKGYEPSWRTLDTGERFLTDDNNYIIDLHIEKINSPHKLSKELIEMVGVVEHGLFLDTVDIIIVGKEDGPKVIEVG